MLPKTLFPVILLCALLFGVPIAHAAPVRSQHTEAELIAEDSTLVPGRPFWVALRLRMDPHWHTYWENAGEAGLPTTLKWQLPNGWHAGPIHWPAPSRFVQGGVVNFGYDGEVLLLVNITPPANLTADEPITLKAQADWLECADICVPGRAQLALDLPVTAGPPIASVHKPAFDNARAQWPSPLPAGFQAKAWRTPATFTLSLTGPTGTPAPAGAFFFSRDATVSPSAPQTATTSASTLVLTLTREKGVPDPATLSGVLSLPRGFLGNGTPAAYTLDLPFEAGAAPVPSAATATPSNTPPRPGLGKVLVLAFFGGLILNLMPCVFPVLGLKIMGFVKQAGASRRRVVLHGLTFTLGVLVSFWVLVAVLSLLRAGGHQLGWGFQLQEPGFVLALALFLFIFGLNLSGVFEVGYALMGVGSRLSGRSGLAGSFFSGVLATVVATPCAAPMLAPALGAALALPPLGMAAAFTAIALGLSTPYLLLCAYPRLVQALPKPGAWMESFKQFMAFALYATAAYLLWTLAGQVGDERFQNILFGFVLAALACWIYGRWGAPQRSPRTRSLGRLTAATVLGAALFLAYAPETKLAWEPWSPARLEELRAQGRPVYVDFTARWCATCQVNKRAVFSSKDVLDELGRRDFALLKADWTNRDPAITAALERFGRAAVPFNLVYLPNRSDPIILPEVLTPAIVLDAISQ